MSPVNAVKLCEFQLLVSIARFNSYLLDPTDEIYKEIWFTIYLFKYFMQNS